MHSYMSAAINLGQRSFSRQGPADNAETHDKTRILRMSDSGMLFPKGDILFSSTQGTGNTVEEESERT